MPEERYEATGRRKTSVARVRLHPGDGTMYMNGRAVAEYLRRDSLEMILVQPLELTETRTTFDIHISTPAVAVCAARPAPPAWGSPAR